MLRDGPAAESSLCENGNGGSAVPLVDGKERLPRALGRKIETLGKITWKFSNVAGELQKELVAFLMATDGDREHAPPHLASLLKKIGNGVLES
ncbi:hypothetical protein C2845_PM14G17100 [Panicum miliaceum]|uniref:Uncharacterized protein n=1 Tax=Panicum miliaceum TaxID=4540 RepID=A0A3L6PPP3_PANMI|nr:hypothetical protein C2845_PM14G17100 [Panicum miliaceum]